MKKSVVALVMVGGLYACAATEYNIPEPCRSKALNPVVISESKDLKPLVIASKGKAAVPIVCPKEHYYRQIADLLKTYLDKATGATFEIVETAPKDGRAVFIGPSEVPSVKKAFQRAQSLPAESLMIESVPEGLVIAGKDAECENRLEPKKELDINDRHQSRGSFFAMTDFLERLVGFRFYFPGIGTHVPELAAQDLVIPPVSYSDTPVFDIRALGYGGGSDFKLIKATTAEASFWNTLLRLGDVKLKMAWHTDAHWHKVYGQTHPEYFALRDDGTRAVGDRGEFSAYRCYSSEEGFKAHIAAIDNYYKTGEGRELFLAENREFAPNKKYIHWGIADAFRGCSCAKCLPLTDTGTPGGLYSKVVWRYVVDLAKQCKERWPDKVIMTMVYGKYRHVPDFVEKENPGNLVIFPTSHGSMSCSAAFLKEPKIWADANDYLGKLCRLSCEKPYIWEHYPHTRKFPLPYLVPHYYQKFIMENKDRISGMLFNGDPRYSYAFDSLMLYMMYKIIWNPDFNVDACVDEYCATLFGPAAKEIAEYYKTVIDRWENVKWSDAPDPKIEHLDVPNKCYWVETYPRKLRDSLEQLLLSALSKAEKGTIYYDRAKFLVDGTAPFFEQGRFIDLGKVFKYECRPWTPDKLDGLVGEWHPAGMRALTLVRNDNGTPDDDVKALIYLSYDEKNLYIAGKIEQKDPFVTKGKGTKSERDCDIWANDSLEVFLCSEQPGFEEAGLDQKSQYHQFIIDPDGSIWDGYKSSEMHIGANFDIACKTVTCKDPERMYFEMAIPFSELKCVPPKPGAKWFVNFYWNHPRDGKHTSYTWAGTGGHHDTSRFGVIEFVDGKK